MPGLSRRTRSLDRRDGVDRHTDNTYLHANGHVVRFPEAYLGLIHGADSNLDRSIATIFASGNTSRQRRRSLK